MKTNKTKENNFFKEMFDYYKNNMVRKHIIIFIVVLLIFFASIAVLLRSVQVEGSQIDAINGSQVLQSKNLLKVIFYEKLPLVALIIFAGITPFVYIPLLGVVEPYILAKELIYSYYGMSGFNVVGICLGIIIELFGISMAITLGINFCRLSSKRFRYSQTSVSSFANLRKSFYAATGNTKKEKKLEKKMNQSAKDKEKLNVKIPYNMLISVGAVAFIIVLIGTLISKGV